MTTLSHRERALKALNHEETDRVPIDMGGAGATSIHVVPYRGLVKLLALEKEAGPLEDNAPAMVSYLRSMAAPSEAVLQRLGIDFRGLSPGQPDSAPIQMLGENSYRDEWGIVWVRAGEGRPFMNKTGPFEEKEPTLADLEKYRWPDPRDPGRVRGLRAKAEKLRREVDCAVVLNLPYCILRESQRLRGFAEAMADLLANPALAHGMMEHIVEVSAGIATAAVEEVGDLVDVVMISEDMGTQEQCFMRPRCIDG